MVAMSGFSVGEVSIAWTHYSPEQCMSEARFVRLHDAVYDGLTDEEMGCVDVHQEVRTSKVEIVLYPCDGVDATELRKKVNGLLVAFFRSE